MSTKPITVRFHLAHLSEKQAWEKLMSLRNERCLSFSQAVTDAVNAYEASSIHFSREDEERLVQTMTDSVCVRLQQMLPSYLAGYAQSQGMGTDLSVMKIPKPLRSSRPQAQKKAASPVPFRTGGLILLLFEPINT